MFDLTMKTPLVNDEDDSETNLSKLFADDGFDEQLREAIMTALETNGEFYAVTDETHGISIRLRIKNPR